jgi:hypothetical protein
MGKLESNKDNFEDQWRDAFDGAKVPPPARVWENIEHKLTFDQIDVYQKKLFVYKWAAVVAILVAVSVSFANLMRPSNLNDTRVDGQSNEVFGSFMTTSIDDGKVDVRSGQHGVESLKPMFLAGADEKDPTNPILNSQISISDIQHLFVESKSGEELAKIPFVRSHAVEAIPDWKYRKVSTYKKDKVENKFWAGLSVGADQFDPNYQQQSPSALSTAVVSAKNFVNTSGSETVARRPTENMEVGMMRQMAMNMGMKLTNRLTLESGVQYAEASVTNYTNVLVENRYYPAAIPVTNQSAGLNQVGQVAKQKEIVEWEYQDVELNNQFQFATIPLKAGYILMDNRVHLRLNAGVVTNVYLGNTLDHPSDEIATFNITPGEASPYKNLSFSGITGVSMGYQVFNGFDMVLEPNYSRSLQSITKADANFNVNPVGFGMNAGIRYRFK